MVIFHCYVSSPEGIHFSWENPPRRGNFPNGSTISADWRRGAVLGRSSKPSEPGAGKVHQKWPFLKGGKG